MDIYHPQSPQKFSNDSTSHLHVDKVAGGNLHSSALQKQLTEAATALISLPKKA